MKPVDEIAKEIYDKVFTELPCIYPPEYRDVLKLEISQALQKEREQAAKALEEAAAREVAIIEDCNWLHGKLQAKKTLLMDEVTGDFIECVRWADIDPLFDEPASLSEEAKQLMKQLERAERMRIVIARYGYEMEKLNCYSDPDITLAREAAIEFEATKPFINKQEGGEE